jgi:hypothetical protein
MSGGEDGTVGSWDQASIQAYLAANPGATTTDAQNAMAGAAGGALTGWTLPKAPGAKYFEPGTGNPWVTPGWQRSANEFFSTPTSGYGAYMAPGGADYGAQLGRWSFSSSAPVPPTAPRGWGRYPGTPGGVPTAPWVQNPVTSAPPSGGGGPITPKAMPTGGYYNPTNLPQTGASTNPPAPVTPPSTGGWMPGPATSQVPQNTLSGFQFQNAAPGSVEAAFNALQAKYGPQEAMSFLVSQGSAGRNGTQSPLNSWALAMQAGGMSGDDVNRVINQFNPSGSGGIANNSLAGYDNTFAQRMGGLLSSVGQSAPTFDKEAYRARIAAAQANTPKPVWRG